MYHGEGAIRRQAGEWGFYASVRLDLVPVLRDPPCAVVLGSEDEEWRLPVEFGVLYALDRLREPRVFEVRASLHTNPVDTSPIVVVAATARAVFAALGRSTGTPQPDVDAETKRLTFPK